MAYLHVAIATVNTALAHREIVRWLAPIEYEAEYYMEDLEHARKLRHSGTCEWIRTQPEFRRWSESTASTRESLLWIHAIPGAGKTVLSSFLIDHAVPFGFRPSSTVFYFLFKNTDIDKNSITAAARSLLYQLYKTRGSTDAPLVDDIKKHLDDSGQSHAKSFKTIWTLFCEYAAKVTGLMIIIDALDECIEPRFLIRGLQQLSKNSAAKIMVTSRREKELVKDLRDWVSIEMGSKEVAADIAAFLEYKISKSPKLSHPFVRSSVLKLLQSRSNGMFLWVALMIKDLKSKASIYEIQDALLALPEGLYKMYERILRRLHTSLKPSPKELCLRVLRWVVCATRPLKVKELEEALKLEYTGETRLFDFDNAMLYTERDIELACGSLLTVRSGTVQLVHLSAREFLQDPSIRSDIDNGLHQYLVDVPSVSPQIASHCVSYLLSQCAPPELLPEDEIRTAKYDVDDLKQRLPLLDYACFNWLKHLVDSIEVPLDDDRKMFQTFFESSCCLIWMQLCFNLNRDCSLRLQTDIQDLLDWANSHSDSSGPSVSTPPVLIRVATEWAGNFQNFLTEYGNILKYRSFEVYFIDPERIFGSLPSSFYRNDHLPLPFERHIVLTDPETGSVPVAISEKHRLPQYTGRSEELGFFYLDPIRDVFYVIDKYPQGPPRIFVQERSTGRRLSPLTDPELDDVKEEYFFGGACMSNDGHYLAVFLEWYLENGSHFCHTAVWAIAKKLDFELQHRSSLWGKKFFSSTVESEYYTFNESVRPVVFAEDGSLCCPSGQITFSTGEVHPIPSELLDEEHAKSTSYSEDGKSLFWTCENKQDESEIELFTLEGEILRSFAMSGTAQFIAYYASDCEFVVYWSLFTEGRKMLLLEFHTGTTKELDIPPIPSGNRYSFTHYDKDKLLGIASYGTGRSIKTRIFVWAGIPLKPHLWAAKELANEILGYFFDERSLLLYVVFPSRIWGRISLESSMLIDMDSHIAGQSQSYPIRVEYCLSRNEKKFAVLKWWKLRYAANELHSFFEFEYKPTNPPFQSLYSGA